MKRLLCLALALALVLCSVSCNKVEEKEYYDAYFTAMDTQVTVRLARDSGNKDGKEIIYFEDTFLEDIATECSNIANKVERMFSRTDENSLTSEVNAPSDSFFDLDEEFCALLTAAYQISDETEGAFDVTLGTVTELWDVTSDSPVIPSDEAVNEALSHVGKDKIVLEGTTVKKTDRLTKLDFGAIAKGYALSLITEYLESTDVIYGLVSFGGNVSVFGSKGEEIKYKVGITDPSDTSKVVGYVYIEKGYVSVSGDYERFFEKDSVKYHHIMDGKTGRPAETDITSVSVICSDGTLADALSTALFVMGSEKAVMFAKSNTYDFDWVITLKDGTTLVSDNLLANELFEEYVEPEVTQQSHWR